MTSTALQLSSTRHPTQLQQCRAKMASGGTASTVGNLEAERDSESRKRLYWYHCHKYLSKSTFYQHKQLYFDEEGAKKWKRAAGRRWVSFEFSPNYAESETEAETSATEIEEGTV